MTGRYQAIPDGGPHSAPRAEDSAFDCADEWLRPGRHRRLATQARAIPAPYARHRKGVEAARRWRASMGIDQLRLAVAAHFRKTPVGNVVSSVARLVRAQPKTGNLWPFW